jgi:DAK2 domain fusion protein YloV
MTGATLRGWLLEARDSLDRSKDVIDSLNVFPVPDGDTGTNLLLTLEAACAEVETCADPEMAPVAEAAARGALLGARGNSGVIVSQILRGVGRALSESTSIDGGAIARALRLGADQAYRAVARPVEGTILTVIRAAAEAAERAVESGTAEVSQVLDAARAAAMEALERTPQMLDVLRRAGVVDAGGQGLVVILDAWARVANVDGGDPVVVEGASIDVRPGSVSAEDYEVMFLLDAERESADQLREELDRLGTSVVVVGDEDLWNVHVHTEDAGAAIEAGLRVGRPYRIRVTHLGSQEHETVSARGVVVVTHGAQIEHLVRDAGGVPVSAKPREAPATRTLVEAIEEARASAVILLPSDSDCIGVAGLAAELAREMGYRVVVIPTRSIVQSLAALAVHDPTSSFDDDVVTMTRAAGATRYAAVTTAVRDALTIAGPCRTGDILGVVGGEIAHVGSDLVAVCQAMMDELIAVDGSLVTLVTGSDARTADIEFLTAWLGRAHPTIEVVVYTGGQPLWPFIIGVE